MTMNQWPIENVPDEARLFYRVHVNSLHNGELVPAVFRPLDGGLSTDWDRYCLTSHAARNRAHTPADNGIITLIAGPVRAVDELRVEHTPQDDNQAHTEVFGMELDGADAARSHSHKLKVRSQLFDRFKTWEIPPDAEVVGT